MIAKRKPLVIPRFSWSLLAAIPTQRFLSIARKLGCYDKALKETVPGRRAENVLNTCIERNLFGIEQVRTPMPGIKRVRTPIPGRRKGDSAKQADVVHRTETPDAFSKVATIGRLFLNELSVTELRALSRKLGMPAKAQPRTELANDLLQKPSIRLDPIDYDGCSYFVNDDDDLRAWVAYYVKMAEDDGGTVDLNNEDDTPIESTIRLVCDLWQYCEWPDWLMWQQYGGPVGRGPWWVADKFEEPCRWSQASMFLRNPWDFAFSNMFMASDSNDITFWFHKPDNSPISKSEHSWLAEAVLDGMREDYEDDDFLLACTKKPRSLVVRIWNREDRDSDTDDEEGTSYKPGKDGICWWA